MTREEAIRRIKAWNLDPDDREVLAVIIPELEESEDERIRKWLLDYAIEMIAGLESDISLSTYDGVKGHDPEAEAELAQWQKARAYLEKQKDLDKMIVVSPEVWDKAIADAFENGKKDGEKRKEPKPAEINEYNIIKKHITYDSLSSEVNKRLKECGWYFTEEDERILKGIIGKIDHDQTYGVSKAEMLSFLKSLRPDSYKNCNSRWKPSEEQMEALKDAVRLFKETHFEKFHYKIESLYEQLQKL